MTTRQGDSSSTGISMMPRLRHKKDVKSSENDDLISETLLDRWKLDQQAEDWSEEGADTEASAIPLTVKLVDLIQTQHEQEYLDWQRGISKAMEDVVHPSRTSSILLREASDDNNLIRFVLFFRFESRASAAVWHDSDSRKGWLQKLSETQFFKSSPQDHLEETDNEACSSMDDFPMFHVSTCAAQKRQRWRTAFLVWLQVFGLVELLGILLPLLLGHVTWHSLSLHVQIAASTAVTTLCIECCTMKWFVKGAQFFHFLQ